MNVDCKDCGREHKDGDSLNGYCPGCVDKFTKREEAEQRVAGEITKQLESVLTIDGRGRPKKAQLLLELLKTHGHFVVIQRLEEISKRKFI